MKNLNFYSYHAGIAEHRFDHNNSLALEKKLAEKLNVTRIECEGNGKHFFQKVRIDHGSILIFEDADTGEFRVFDFGDSPYITLALSKLRTFKGAVIGQYNPKYWDDAADSSIRSLIKGGFYPETVWQFGELNYQSVQEYRSNIKLDNRLHWRGSLYNVGSPENYLGVRKAVELLPKYLSQDYLHLQASPIPFEQYIQEALNFKVILSIGGGGGCLCGDFCLRDIEMFGLGIPIIRPQYVVETSDPLVPNVHYIAVDAEFDEYYRYKNPEILSQKITQRYLEVIENSRILEEVSYNARQWYIRNLSQPNITTNLIKLLGL